MLFCEGFVAGNYLFSKSSYKTTAIFVLWFNRHLLSESKHTAKINFNYNFCYNPSFSRKILKLSMKILYIYVYTYIYVIYINTVYS